MESPTPRTVGRSALLWSTWMVARLLISCAPRSLYLNRSFLSSLAKYSRRPPMISLLHQRMTRMANGSTPGSPQPSAASANLTTKRLFMSGSRSSSHMHPISSRSGQATCRKEMRGKRK